MENAGRTMMGDRQQKGSRKEQRFKDDQFESKIPGNNPPMSFFTYIFTLKVDKKIPRPMDLSTCFSGTWDTGNRTARMGKKGQSDSMNGECC